MRTIQHAQWMNQYAVYSGNDPILAVVSREGIIMIAGETQDALEREAVTQDLDLSGLETIIIENAALKRTI